MTSGGGAASLFRVCSRWDSKCNTMYEIIKVRVSEKNSTKPTRLVSKPGSAISSAAKRINTPFRTGTVGVSPRSNCWFNSIQHLTPVWRTKNAPINPPTSTLNTISKSLRKQSIRVSSPTGINTSISAVRQYLKAALLKGLKRISRWDLSSIEEILP